MNQRSYIEEVLRLFLQQPDTPATAKKSDWAVASDFYRQGIPFDIIAYAIRLATVRRIQRDPDNGPLQPIRSLAYYRIVFNSIAQDELDAGYVGWITSKHAELLAHITITKPRIPSKTRHDSQNLALFDRR